MYGKFGYNVENQFRTEIIATHKRHRELMNGKYNRADFDIINDNMCVATYHCNDKYSEHYRSIVYVTAFVTVYARLKLFSALELLDDKVLYFDTDSVMYCSPTDSHILPVDNSGTLGAWADEMKKSPKTYALKSSSGKIDICKAKGFTLSYKNSHSQFRFAQRLGFEQSFQRRLPRTDR